MASPPWEDLSEFFDPDEFATSARLYRGAADLGEVFGIFDNPTERKELGDFTLDQTGPRFLSPEPAGLAARRGDVLDLSGELYDVVQNAARDGSGLVVIPLAEQAGSHAPI